MSNILKLVLTDHWFEEIKSGRKTHEYREFKTYWNLRLIPTIQWKFVEFQKAYRKNAEKMLFEIKSISIRRDGINTDLKIDNTVYDIELGERVTQDDNCLEIDDIVYRIYRHYDFGRFDGWEVDDMPYKITEKITYTDKYGTSETMVLCCTEKNILNPYLKSTYEISPNNVFKSLETAQNECNQRNEIEKQDILHREKSHE